MNETTINIFIGLITWFCFVVSFVWFIAAIIRAIRTESIRHWPLHGRWIFAGFIFGVTLFFAEASYVRLFVGEFTANPISIVLRSMSFIFIVWALWRWLCGDILDSNDRDIRNTIKED